MNFWYQWFININKSIIYTNKCHDSIILIYDLLILTHLLILINGNDLLILMNYL